MPTSSRIKSVARERAVETADMAPRLRDRQCPRVEDGVCVCVAPIGSHPNASSFAFTAGTTSALGERSQQTLQNNNKNVFHIRVALPRGFPS